MSSSGAGRSALAARRQAASCLGLSRVQMIKDNVGPLAAPSASKSRASRSRRSVALTTPGRSGAFRVCLRPGGSGGAAAKSSPKSLQPSAGTPSCSIACRTAAGGSGSWLFTKSRVHNGTRSRHTTAKVPAESGLARSSASGSAMSMSTMRRGPKSLMRRGSAVLPPAGSSGRIPPGCRSGRRRTPREPCGSGSGPCGGDCYKARAAGSRTTTRPAVGT